MFHGLSRRPARGLRGVIVFFLAGLSANIFAATPADETNAVWVLTKHDGIPKLAQSDATLLHVVDDLVTEPVSLAVDNRRFVVWVVTANRQLHALNVLTGARQFSVPLPPRPYRYHEHHDDDDDSNHILIAVNENDGSLWLAEKRGLYKYDASGTLVSSQLLEKKARAMAFDPGLNRLWVATRNRILALDANGITQFTLPQGRSGHVEGLSVDSADPSLWVVHERRLQRYDPLGGRLLDLSLKTVGKHVNEPRAIAADGRGNVWLAAGRELLLINANGAVVKRLTPFPKAHQYNNHQRGNDKNKDDRHRIGGRRIQAIAANTDDGSVWVIGRQTVAHVDQDGQVLAAFSWDHKLEDLALSFDRTPPVINITSPHEGAKVIARPTFSLTYSDEGSGVDTASIAFTVNGQPADFACTETAAGSDCVPHGAFTEVDLSVSATIKDHAGNVSNPATVNVKLDSDGDGYADDVDAFPNDPNEWSDLDGDGIGDNSDPDKDGDGYNNDVDAFPDNPAEWKDTDGDGIGDNSDPDIDGDGHENAADAFPLDPNEWSDLDRDGVGDNSDPDIDNDGVANAQDLFPTDPTESADLDGDGIGNNSDPDRDGDNVANADDLFPDDPNRWKLPVIKITSPASLITVGASPVTVSGTVDDASASVTVNGVPVSNSGSFTAQVSLIEGFNSIVARAVDVKGSEATASIVVTLDATPPHVTIQSPKEGETVTTASINVTGLVNDIVRGTVAEDQANVSVNGVVATVSNRSYLAENVPLQAGANTITVTASDKVGNTETASITVNYTPITGARVLLSSGSGQTANILHILPNPLVAKLVNANGTPAANKEVIFRVIQGDGKVGTGAATDQRAIAVNTDANGLASTKFTLGSRAGQGNQRVRASAVGFNGEAIFYASANPNPGNKISIQSGNNQRTAILSPVPAPLVVTVTDEGGNAVQGAAVTYKVAQGAGLFDNGTQTIDVLTDSDGRASVNFTVGREEGKDNHRVTASLTGTLATAGFTASALMPGDPGNTVITGVVMDNQDTPLPNVTIRVEGTNRQAVSDGKGIFTITEVPVGPVRLLVEGQTTTIAGDWPTLSYDLVTVAGATNTLPAPIYLVPLNTKSAKIVGSEDVTLTLDEVPGFALTVKKGSVTFPDGAKTGKMSVTVVNSSKVPMPPPNGMQPQFIVTIQPTGARFDPPAQLQLPNVDGHKPGAEVEMYSYDHDLEEFVTIGWGTVSEDGKVIKSNEGVGVIKAGWHCGSLPDGGGCAHRCANACLTCNTNCVCEIDPNKEGKAPVESVEVWHEGPDPSLSGWRTAQVKNPCKICNKGKSNTNKISEPDKYTNSAGNTYTRKYGAPCWDDGRPGCKANRCENGECTHEPVFPIPEYNGVPHVRNYSWDGLAADDPYISHETLVNNIEKTQDAFSCLQEEVRLAGGNIDTSVGSAYRPPAYQKHLQDVWHTYKKLRNNTDSECNSIFRNAEKEWNDHHPSRTQPPVNRSPHSSGNAFDANVYVPDSYQNPAPEFFQDPRDFLAWSCGLHRFDSEKDPWHYSRDR